MVLLPDVSAVLNNALGATNAAAAGYSGGVRNAMVFSSRLRKEAGAIIRTEASLPESAAPSFLDGIDVAGVLRTISMPINPNMVRFRQPKRWTKKDTREGSVFFHFTNSRGQNNDVLTIELTGNTGNLDRRGSLSTAGEEAEAFAPTGTGVASEDDTGAIQKLLAIQNLYLLTREPMVLSDGYENTFTIDYISTMFPVAIRFKGFFNQVLEFEEDARKPNSRNYRFEFTVQDTSPPLDEVIGGIFTALQNSILGPDADGTILGPNVTVRSP